MTSGKRKILEEVLPLKLIRAVERWPVLYMKDCPERNNQHFRNKVWQEVAKGLIENWESLSQPEKDLKGVELSRKWRNLRDTFKRQLLFDKKVRQGQRVKRKEYVYFKHMTFLLPHVTAGDDDDESAAPCRTAAAAPAAAAAGGRHARRRRPMHETRRRRRSTRDVDEDEHFLMSLLPSLKRMTDDEKLTAKMDILKVIKEVRGSGSGSAPPRTSAAAGPLPVLEVNALYDPHADSFRFNEDQLTVKQELFAEDDNSASELSAGEAADSD